MEFGKEYYKFFVDEMNKYVDGVNFLNQGIENWYIEKMETKLKVKLPEEYRGFLRIYNGGEIFRPGTVLSEIYINPNDRVRGGYYLNDVFDEKYKITELPENLLFIATMNYGDKICIDMSNSREIAKIMQWDIQTGEITREWSSFKDWLSSCLEAGEMLVDYDGSEKEINF